jgi:transcriptional regulator with XRE-family HTH domain
MDKRLLAGQNLRRLIKEHNLTQQTFADDFYTDLRNVNRWINNGIKDIDKIQELADYFDVSFFEFFKEE